MDFWQSDNVAALVFVFLVEMMILGLINFMGVYS